MTDPIADMLTRVRNASRALLPTVDIPHSKLKESIARILQHEGYIADLSVVEQPPYRWLRLKLKYEGRRPVIEGLQRISKPGLRHYVNSKQVPRVRNGLGTAILSTSQGVLSDRQARKNKVGGEVLCYVW